MLALAIRHTNKLIRRTVAETGTRLGRFFTPRAAAAELAEVLSYPEKEELRVLDAGAGTGILSADGQNHVGGQLRQGHISPSARPAPGR